MSKRPTFTNGGIICQRTPFIRYLERQWEEDEGDFSCPTCNGRGTVNPLTAPEDFFCVGTTDCPTCDGTGEI